jgi:hypothetical protein
LPGTVVGVVLDFEVEVEVEVVPVELELELEVVVEEPDGELEVVVVEPLDELLESGVQVSVSDTTTPVMGRLRFEIGVPGGTLTLNV